MALNKVCFLDKDGTLVVDEPFNVDIAKVKFMPKVFEALKMIQDVGLGFVIVTNQSGLARGLFRGSDLFRLFGFLKKEFKAHGLNLMGVQYCPHEPKTCSCLCRKPSPGLFFEAAKRYLLDLSKSWMLGDILDDVEAGHRAGCRSVLVHANSETEWDLSGQRIPHFTATSILQAAEYIRSAHLRGPDGQFVKNGFSPGAK